jgi:hypothetical protein
MAWFRNYYRCARCDREWTDEWSCMCEDDCPYCEERHMSPRASDDLTEVIESRGDSFVILRSPETAEDEPDYNEVGEFRGLAEAEAFLAARRSM